MSNQRDMIETIDSSGIKKTSFPSKHKTYIFAGYFLIIIAIFLPAFNFYISHSIWNTVLYSWPCLIIIFIVFRWHNTRYIITQDSLICKGILPTKKISYKEILEVEKYNLPKRKLSGYEFDSTSEKYRHLMPSGVKYQLQTLGRIDPSSIPTKNGKRYRYSTSDRGLLITLKDGSAVFVSPSNPETFIAEINDRLRQKTN